MTNKFFNSYTVGKRKEKLAAALLRVQDSDMNHIVKYVGVPEAVIRKAAKIANIKVDTKQDNYPLIPTDRYDEMVAEEMDEDESINPEDWQYRIQTAIEKAQSKCDHTKFFVRCSCCMKVLGSELTHISIKDAVNIVSDNAVELIRIPTSNEDQIFNLGVDSVTNKSVASLYEFSYQLNSHDND